MGSPDALAYAAQVRAQLIGPGGPFELRNESVRGNDIPVYVNRAPSLRSLFDGSLAFGHREYLVDERTRLSYAEHHAGVLSLAAALAERFGVRRMDRVMVLAANSPQWVQMFWATNLLGAIAVAGNAWWTPREVEYAVGHSAPKVVIADARRLALLDGIDVPVIAIDDLPTEDRSELPIVAVGEDEPALIMYTSGTTGRPKGAVHSHRNLLQVIEYHRLNDALASALGAAPSVPRRFLMSLPLFHIASLHNLVIPRLVTGDTVVIDNGRFDPERVLGVIERERVTNWAVVPTMAHRLADYPDLKRFDISSLAAVSVNSAPSSEALKQRLRTAIPAVRHTLADSYGLTESTTAITIASAMDLAANPTSVGRTIPGVELQIRDVDGTVLPDGVEGEICTRSAFVMLGYWADDEASAASITPDGWLRTGDIGSVRDGMLFMSARRSDLILRGGENVYPAEIEAVLDEHPDVIESAVFGVEHADLGQGVAAVVVTGSAITVEQLTAFVAERLAYYKVPSRWRITDTSLARTATGKVIRSGLAI